MKNVVLLILALILTSTSVYAFYERFMDLEPGVYTCTLSYQKAKCIVKQDKLGGTYYHNCGSITNSTIKRLLNENIVNNNYLLSITINTEISAGLTPPILDACPKVAGRTLASFSLVSVEIC